MATGWARDGAVQEQIDASVEDAVKRAREGIPRGESAAACSDCGDAIPEARQKAIPGVRRCVGCQADADAKSGPAGGINRRGSKDSQLR